MSVLSKLFGLDRHPEQLDAINAALRGVYGPEWGKAKAAFFNKAEALHVPAPTAVLLWGNLCETLKVPKEMR